MCFGLFTVVLDFFPFGLVELLYFAMEVVGLGCLLGAIGAFLIVHLLATVAVFVDKSLPGPSITFYIE